MRDLNVTLVQTELAWEDIRANLNHFDRIIDGLDKPTDLILLPEMFSTGFSMNASGLAESMDGRAVTWMRDKAEQKKAVLAGSLMIKEHRSFFNRLVWARPDRTCSTYDKKHLFRYAGEEKIYTAGAQQATLDLHGWKIRPFICYDLRFPIWTRNLNQSYDLCFFVANWPAKRADHWRALLRARAIENQAFVIGVNRVGQDGNGFDYSGLSAVIDPLGNVRFEQAHESCCPTVTLDPETVTAYRSRFPAWMDSDGDMLC